MRTTEQSKRNETAQGSLFATQSCSKPVPTSEEIVPLFLLQNYLEHWEGNPKPSHSLSRSTDSQTSKKAGEKTKEFRARHISKIWGCLKDQGPKTYKEIALLIGMEPVQVARRRKEMEENHLIEVLEETRNGCALWIAKC